jgi:hypothetical protein
MNGGAFARVMISAVSGEAVMVSTHAKAFAVPRLLNVVITAY